MTPCFYEIKKKLCIVGSIYCDCALFSPHNDLNPKRDGGFWFSLDFLHSATSFNSLKRAFTQKSVWGWPQAHPSSLFKMKAKGRSLQQRRHENFSLWSAPKSLTSKSSYGPTSLWASPHLMVFPNTWHVPANAVVKKGQRHLISVKGLESFEKSLDLMFNEAFL